jgi:prevent-host-death family protein
MKKSMTATEARKKFYAIIAATEHPGVSVVITHDGLPKVVVMSFEEFEGWQETMEIMADPDPSLDRDIREGIREMKKGKVPKGAISLDALKKELNL